MLNNKNVLVNGCSFSRGPNSWPYYLQQLQQFNLINLAQAGAGNRYIHDSTISELSKRQYDFVFIMWSGLERIDCRVKDIDFFDKSKCTSKYQHQRNDWPEKKIHPINDQDYVEKNWVFGVGIINNDSSLISTGLFNEMYKHIGLNELTSQSIIHMVSLQSILKLLNINYVFMFYQDYQEEISKYSEYKLLDTKNIFNQQNIYTITKENNWYAEDNLHPSSQAHKIWADNLNNFLIEKYAKTT
jgi:hypothetical protein